jgi:hypothetical protein
MSMLMIEKTFIVRQQTQLTNYFEERDAGIVVYSVQDSAKTETDRVKIEFSN